MPKKKLEAEDVKLKMNIDSQYATKMLREFGQRLDLEPAERHVNGQFMKRGRDLGHSFSKVWNGLNFDSEGRIIYE